MKGLQRIVRRAIMTRLKASPDVTALVPSTSIYGQSPDAEPAWPFIKMGPPSTTPRRASCLDAGTVLVSVHGFSKGRYSDDVLLETAEDHAGRIGAAIEAALDAKGEDITDGVETGRVRYMLADRLLLVDSGEAGAYHWFANVIARVTAS
jgi:hypothetical protein